MAISNYNTDPDLNVDISGINIAEGCPPSGINNAIRQMMADVKSFTDAPTFSGGMIVSSGATISGGISADTLTVSSGATINGALTCGGKDVALIENAGSNYIRLSDGFQMCWGSAITSSTGAVINFASAFNIVPRVVIQRAATTTPVTSNTYAACVTSVTSTGCKAYGHSVVSGGAVAFSNVSTNWVAVGTWK